ASRVTRRPQFLVTPSRTGSTLSSWFRHSRSRTQGLPVAQQARDCFRVRGVAAQHAMGAAEPQIPWLRDRVFGHWRCSVRAVVRIRIGEEVLDFGGIKPGQRQIEVEIAQFLQLGSEEIGIPLSLFVATIVHEPVRFDLRRREIRCDVYWNLLETEL